MIAACREHGVRLCYAEDWLFAPALLRAKELIEEGAIGRLLAMRARECHSGSHSPFARRRETCGGGAMIHLGAHPIAAARWLVEDEPVAVTASFSGGGDSNLLHPDFEGEDWGVVIVEFEHGARATIEANYITLGGRNDVVEICGTEGFLKVDLTLGSPIQAFSRSGLNYAVEKADTTIGWTRPAVDELVEHGFVNQMAHFADCIMQGNEPKAGTRGEDGRTVLRIALTATESASSGKRVHL